MEDSSINRITMTSESQTDTIRNSLHNIGAEFKIHSDDLECRVITPFTLHNGDPIVLWITEVDDGRYMIRDHGESYTFLEMYGAEPTSGLLRPKLAYIKDQFDLNKSYAHELVAFAYPNQLGQRVVDVIQGSLAVTYLIFMFSSPQAWNG